jgi:hypothetical protein
MKKRTVSVSGLRRRDGVGGGIAEEDLMSSSGVSVMYFSFSQIASVVSCLFLFCFLFFVFFSIPNPVLLRLSASSFLFLRHIPYT